MWVNVNVFYNAIYQASSIKTMTQERQRYPKKRGKKKTEAPNFSL